MSKALRYLRIAFSATCVIAAVLLIALWVRSYWWDDVLPIYVSPTGIIIFQSRSGTIKTASGLPSPFFQRTPWRVESNPKAAYWQNTDRVPNQYGFGIRQNSANFIVRFPHWFYSSLFALFAVVPWIRWRFSLRTLLIATTLVAVVMGLVVWAARQLENAYELPQAANRVDAMSDSWRNLRMGDRIRILRMPPVFSQPNFYVAPETLALYELLISTSDAIEIDDFLDDGTPVAGYVDRRKPENPVFHGLMISDADEGCWERVFEIA